MFFNIGVLKSFANFTGEHLCWSSFLKNLQAEGLQLHKKSPTQVFSWEVCEHLFLHNTFGECFWTSGGCFWFFFKKKTTTAISQPCYDVLKFFSPRHIVWCIKGRTHLFVRLSSIFRLSNTSVRMYPIKLKSGILDHMNDTSRNNVFQVSVDVPLIELQVLQ